MFEASYRPNRPTPPLHLISRAHAPRRVVCGERAGRVRRGWASRCPSRISTGPRGRSAGRAGRSDGGATRRARRKARCFTVGNGGGAPPCSLDSRNPQGFTPVRPVQPRHVPALDSHQRVGTGGARSVERGPAETLCVEPLRPVDVPRVQLREAGSDETNRTVVGPRRSSLVKGGRR
jgi:hypothetical protein